MSKVLYIINPAGAGGVGTAAWNEFKELCPDEVAGGTVVMTERPGHAREIAGSAMGHDVVAAVGGDGTVGEVMSGIMDIEEERPRLAIIPAGTGNDIARAVGIGSVAASADALRGGKARPVDLLRVDWQADGQDRHQYAFLFGVVGFSSVPMLKPWMKRFLGPVGAYYLATFLQFIVYRAPRMTVRVDGREFEGRYWMTIVGNAELSAGGSMCLAPGARIDDGMLDVTIIHARAKPAMLVGLLPKIASGAHVHEPGVEYFPGKTIEVDSTPTAVIDLDGDIVGTTPARFTVCRHAVQVLCGH